MLFEVKDFWGAFEKMFAEKIHITMLMDNKVIGEEKKQIYLTMVPVLEREFELKRYSKINRQISHVKTK